MPTEFEMARFLLKKPVQFQNLVPTTYSNNGPIKNQNQHSETVGIGLIDSLQKDLVVYQKEIDAQKEKIEQMKSSRQDSYDIKKQVLCRPMYRSRSWKKAWRCCQTLRND